MYAKSSPRVIYTQSSVEYWKNLIGNPNTGFGRPPPPEEHKESTTNINPNYEGVATQHIENLYNSIAGPSPTLNRVPEVHERVAGQKSLSLTETTEKEVKRPRKVTHKNKNPTDDTLF
jgi:hypothetical protein